MPKGSCACGQAQHEYSGEPAAVVVCHCRPCRKFAGMNGSTNAMVKADQYTKPSSSLMQWKRGGDSGKQVAYNNCANCGTIMYVEAEAMPGIYIFKTGTLDDAETLNKLRPGMEIYTKDRPTCFEGLAGVPQKEAAP
ncbi:hypothetical protein KC327_g5005 [Hortaea werneckii]|nr:hypothetical protein KC358_g5108 [Hortaea werneckii]KAI6845886.1 hypothetical protein KC350_g4185 [Hortaea werneckii]KAI6873806.1 hypothetical protein KC338_g1526 [Hortaea werneckii]KAI6875184.1 hypothetical protein KC323_g433 [Hortaea werneckii]KAI6935454.1 hypothetical protein KC348_g6226 [Hortaea werneckii]